MFAVVDVETTGLSPAYQHRIVEVAVVLVDKDGQVVVTWDTLVNPRRDVGASGVHGLRAAELLDAPPFEEIAGGLTSLSPGRVPVAHNWPFEADFLAAEYGRLGVEVPLDRQSWLCTRSFAPSCSFVLGFSPTSHSVPGGVPLKDPGLSCTQDKRVQVLNGRLAHNGRSSKMELLRARVRQFSPVLRQTARGQIPHSEARQNPEIA